MKEIPLTQGQVALVDDADYAWLNQWKWYAHRRKGKRGFYATTHERLANGKQSTISMHRLIMGTPAGLQTDHIDTNKLNNTRSNLRIATGVQNMANCGPQVDNTSGFKCVNWNKARRTWRSQIYVKRKSVHLGCFDTAEKAAKAYDVAALALHGEFARLNFPRENYA